MGQSWIISFLDSNILELQISTRALPQQFFSKRLYYS